MSFYMVDVEHRGACPRTGVMTCFGAVKVTEAMDRSFYGVLVPRTPSENWKEGDIVGAVGPVELVVDGVCELPEGNRDLALYHVMRSFDEWITETNVGPRAIFWSDNPANDWQWINDAFFRTLNRNPFGHSGRRVGDFYSGLMQNLRAATEWKSMRVTPHTHHPVDDARGNVEALLKMCKAFNLHTDFK